jgi:ketosteroid isomerase-like protein
MARRVADFAREMADREAIRDCLTRYGRAIDRCDRALLADVFWPDATTEYEGFFEGGASEYVEVAIRGMSSGMEQTAHLLGNMLIEVQGESAIVESYVFAFHRLPDPAGAKDLLLGGRYVDRFEKREDVWRIRHRTLIADWFREFPDSGDWAKGFFGLKMTCGGRYPADRSYDLLSRGGAP